jgi:peptidylprolyl isomerase
LTVLTYFRVDLFYDEKIFQKEMCMRKAQIGDSVRIHFTASQEDGTQIATTRNENPMDLTIGDKKLIECFEQSIVGMTEGERKTSRIETKDAMGERNPELVKTFPRVAFPEQYEDLKIGGKIEFKDDNGNSYVGAITQLTNHEVRIDANHPLAGKTLVFDIELMAFV